MIYTNIPAPIQRAQEIAREEETELTAEIEAFETFRHRIEDVQAHSASVDPAQTAVVADRRNADSAPHRTVCKAYRETVMDVPHYEHVYDESLVQNMAAEFEPGIAEAVANELPFTPIVRTRLCSAARLSRTTREESRDVVRTELESLGDAYTRLWEVVDAIQSGATGTETDRNARTGGTPRRSIDDLLDRCQRVGADRQSLLQSQVQIALDDQPLSRYLYQDCPWEHPVLLVVATLADDLSAISDDPAEPRIDEPGEL